MRSKFQYMVDLPDPRITEPSDDNCFLHVATFDTRASARKWLLDLHGMPETVADFFISEV